MIFGIFLFEINILLYEFLEHLPYASQLRGVHFLDFQYSLPLLNLTYSVKSPHDLANGVLKVII